MKSLLESEIDEIDCLVMAAAVSDYRAEQITSGKIKKSNTGDRLSLDLVQNPDLLAEVVTRIKSSGRKTLTVGFAAEACDSPKSLEELAIKKLAAKGCDLIVANNVAGGQVFNSDDNEALVISGKAQVVSVGGSKRLVANEIIDIISDMLS
jgi:phosphopantothenoylcysteine decarboxylase/phosphopantothenate--cysteine ligase